MRIALAQINPIVGALAYNSNKILSLIAKCRTLKVDLVVFPELALSGYPPEDLLLMPAFIQDVSLCLERIVEKTKGIGVILGCPRVNPYGGEKFLYNSAAIMQDGELIGFQDKSLLPDYDVFSESRYFEPASRTDVWSLLNKRVAVTICEDIWQHAQEVEYSSYGRDPIQELQKQKPDLLINLSASPYYLKRHETRISVCKAAAKTLGCPVLLCNQVGGNDSLLFDGHSLCVDKEGHLVQRAKGFEEDLLLFDSDSNFKPCPWSFDPMEDLYKALVMGIRDYFTKQNFSKALLGLSGGIDSSLVACLAAEALGKENVQGLSLPSRFTSQESLEDIDHLVKNLGIALETIAIESPFTSFLQLLSPFSFGKEITVSEENLQSRIRGNILMAFSNKFGMLVLGTGNKSELAMGYCTLYGDMCGGLEVIGDVTKTEVYALANWINREKEIIPARILEKAPSAELRPNQKDTDSLPEYAIVDVVLKDYVEERKSIEEIANKRNLSLALVQELVQKIHASEYKRRQAPLLLRVTKKAFNSGRRFPVVQHWNMR